MNQWEEGGVNCNNSSWFALTMWNVTPVTEEVFTVSLSSSSSDDVISIDLDKQTYFDLDTVTHPCDNDEDIDDDFTPACKLYSFIFYSVITGFLCVFGSIGNIVSFLVFYVDRLKTSTSFLFQSLAIIDTFMLIGVFPFFCIPNFISYTGWYIGYKTQVQPIMYVHVFPILLVVQTATIWTTVLVGINRYIAVCMPYQAIRMCTVQQAKRQLAVVLLFSLIYNAPRFAEGRLEYQTVPAWKSCAVHTDFAQQKWYRIAYSNVMYIVFICGLPLLILTALNVRLMSALNDLKRKRREMQSARQQQDNNVTLVLIIVIIVFTICQFPAMMTQIFWTSLSDEARYCGGFQFYFSRVSNVLVTANSALNFFVYFGFNQRFRVVLAHMLGIATHPPTSGSNCIGVGGGGVASRKNLTGEPPLLGGSVLTNTGVGGDQALQLGINRQEVAGGTTTTICPG